MARQALHLKPKTATEHTTDQYSQGRARAGEDERPIGRQLEMTSQPPRTMSQTNESVCSCGKVCKNEKGVNIHRGRMGCPPIVNLVQRARELGETSEEPHPDRHHSVRNLLASENHDTGNVRRENTPSREEEIKRKNKVASKKRDGEVVKF